jgi:hypothetical protein
MLHGEAVPQGLKPTPIRFGLCRGKIPGLPDESFGRDV